MTDAQATYLLESLSQLRGRLQELLQRPYRSVPGWDWISENLHRTQDILREAARCYQEQCRIHEEDVRLDVDPYTTLLSRIRALYRGVDDLRLRFAHYFRPAFSNVIYHYLLLRELISTLPEGLRDWDDCFIVIPGSEFHYWNNPAQCAVLLARFDEPVKRRLDQLSKQRNHSFEIAAEEYPERQMVLVHELFHRILATRIAAHNQITQASLLPAISTALAPLIKSRHGDPIMDIDSKDIDYVILTEWVKKWLRELFCDFAACWYAGPAYIRAFLDEIAFDTSRCGDHPPRSIRAQVIGVLSEEFFLSHPIHSRLQRFDTESSQEARLTSSATIAIVSVFRNILQHTLGLPLIEWKDRRADAAFFFRKKLPFIVQDVRDLLNNVPERGELAEGEAEEFSKFIRESLRKSTLMIEFRRRLGKLQSLASRDVQTDNPNLTDQDL